MSCVQGTQLGGEPPIYIVGGRVRFRMKSPSFLLLVDIMHVEINAEI